MEQACPDESRLLAIVHNEPLDPVIQSHVNGCARCRQAIAALRGQVSTLRQLAPRQQVSIADGAVGPSRRPAFVGKYFIAGVLEEDDRLVVYRAAHGVLYQEVALALARHGDAAAFDRQELVRSARRLIAFFHPVIARTVDFDFFGDSPYVVEQYCAGQPLALFAAKRTPSRPKRLELAIEIAEALAALRAGGLMDVESSRLRPLLDRQGQLRLTGLSSAWLHEAGFGHLAADKEPTSAAGVAQADVQTLGRWLYQLLTGREDVPTDYDSIRSEVRHHGGGQRLARLCADCVSSNAKAPRTSAQFALAIRRLRHRGLKRWRAIFVAILVVLLAWRFLWG
jgi:hypothetical protein